MKELKDIQMNLQRAFKIKPQQASLYLQKLLIKENVTFPKAKRISVYQNGYIIRMTESLKDDFPRVFKHFKKDAHKDIVYEFLKKYPSRYTSIACVSEKFPQFVSCKFKTQKYLSDLAQLEWLECLASYSMSLEAFDFSTVKLKKAEDIFKIKFKISPSVHLMKSNWTVHKSKIKRATTYLVVFKNDEGLQVQAVSLQEYDIFQLLIKGHDLLSIIRKKQKISQKSIASAFEFLTRNKLLCKKALLVNKN